MLVRAIALAKRVAPLALAEAVSRLVGFGVLAVAARTLGADGVGIFTLGQTVAQYAATGTDLGLKSIGARLVAQGRAAPAMLVSAVQSKRALLAFAAAAAVALYALLGPVPSEARGFVLAYGLSVIPLAFSLDWVLWGSERFGALGVWRTGIAVAWFCLSLVVLLSPSPPLAGLAGANAVAQLVGVVALWLTLRRRPSRATADATQVAMATRWSEVGWLGLATFVNQAFHTFGVIMLAALATAREVGFFAAAYKLVFLLLGAYWLVTQALYPRLAQRQQGSEATALVGQLALGGLALGLAFAAVVWPLADWAIRVAYGDGFERAAAVLRVLLIALPLDFVASLLGTAFTAWGWARRLSFATVAGTAVNVLGNAWAIPAYGATGAAWVTIAAYLVLLLILIGMLVVEHSKRRDRAG